MHWQETEEIAPFKVPDDVVDLVRYGQVLDTAKIERAGFQPKHDQRGCLEAIWKD